MDVEVDMTVLFFICEMGRKWRKRGERWMKGRGRCGIWFLERVIFCGRGWGERRECVAGFWKEGKEERIMMTV